MKLDQDELIEVRLARIEAHNEYQNQLLEKLVDLPLACASRGVQLQSLMDADLPKRVQSLEKDVSVGRKVIGGFIAATMVFLTNKYWAAALTGVQNLFR